MNAAHPRSASALGTGLLLIGTALWPPPVPLADALARLHERAQRTMSGDTVPRRPRAHPVWSPHSLAPARAGS